MFLFVSLFRSWMLFMSVFIIVLASNSVSAADWAISVNNMMIPEQTVKEEINVNDDRHTCMLKISYRNDNNNDKNDGRNIDHNTNSTAMENWNTRLVSFEEWHKVSSTIFTTTGVLQLELESSTTTPVRLVVYIGTSSDLFCYSATLNTKRNQNITKIITASMPYMKNTKEASPFSSYNLQTIMIKTMANYSKKDKIIVNNYNNVNLNNVEMNIDKQSWLRSDNYNVELTENVDSVWILSSFAPSCERRLSKYLQSQIHYTDSSFQTTLLPNGSYKYYYTNVSESKAHEFDDKINNAEKASSETLFSTKPPCLLTRVDRFEHVIDVSEEAITNGNINCFENTIINNSTDSTNSETTSRSTISCNFTVDVTVHVPEMVNINTPDSANAKHDIRQMFALKITAAAIPAVNVSSEHSFDNSVLRSATIESTQKNRRLKWIEQENRDTKVAIRSSLQPDTYTTKQNASNKQNICDNVSLPPQFWQLLYPDGDDDICDHVIILEGLQVDNGL